MSLKFESSDINCQKLQFERVQNYYWTWLLRQKNKSLTPKNLIYYTKTNICETFFNSTTMSIVRVYGNDSNWFCKIYIKLFVQRKFLCYSFNSRVLTSLINLMISRRRWKTIPKCFPEFQTNLNSCFSPCIGFFFQYFQQTNWVPYIYFYNIPMPAICRHTS